MKTLYRPIAMFAGAIALLVLALALSACGAGSSAEQFTDAEPAAAHEEADGEQEAEEGHHEDGEGDIQMGHVTLTEWTIAGEGGEPIESLPSGDVMLEVHNDGTAMHQFAIWSGGEVVGDEVQGGELVAETDFISPGDMTSLEVTLEPGDYILTCPVVGHTERGMHSEVAVEVQVE